MSRLNKKTRLLIPKILAKVKPQRKRKKSCTLLLKIAPISAMSNPHTLLVPQVQRYPPQAYSALSPNFLSYLDRDLRLAVPLLHPVQSPLYRHDKRIACLDVSFKNL